MSQQATQEVLIHYRRRYSRAGEGSGPGFRARTLALHATHR